MDCVCVQTFILLIFVCSVKAQVSPLFVPEKDVFFLLRVKNQSFDDGEAFNYQNRESLKSSEFDASKPTVFQVHGFMGGPKMELQTILSK
jgi:hypothetical protein